MKKIILIVLAFFTGQVFGQETSTYQSDSIYKANHIKARLWYSGSNKRLGITTFYDKEGRLIKYQLAPFADGGQSSTYYTYDASGKLVNIVDSTINGKPDPELMKKLKLAGINLEQSDKQNKKEGSVEISKYDLEYSGDKLTKRTGYNADGSLFSVDKILPGGKLRTRDWYRNDKVYRHDTTEYLTKFHYSRYTGWEIRNGNKEEWDYNFKYSIINNRVEGYQRFEKEILKETVSYFYDDKGLLLETRGKFSQEFFEYLYY